MSEENFCQKNFERKEDIFSFCENVCIKVQTQCLSRNDKNKEKI